MRSPNLKGPLLQKKSDSTGDSTISSDQNQKKPRTVHIDVYCTGTEIESDSSSSDSSDSNEETTSTPQTVFESQRMRVTHKKASTTELPLVMRDKKTNIMKTLTQQAKNISDNEDDASTAYPSQLSSFSALRDFSSSFSSVPPSFSTVSMSSYPIPDDYDSVANTSWKDTYSDIGSLMQSRSSITQTDSLDFVPRRFTDYSKTPGIEENPETEIKNPNLLGTPSVLSIQGSDSFEYANSDDRLRIKEMEEMWKSGKAPPLERKHLLQQRKMREYLTKRMSDKNLVKSRDSESEGSDSSEKGWMFVKSDDKKLQRDTTVRRPSKDSGKENDTKEEKAKKDKSKLLNKPKTKALEKEQGSLSDSSSPPGSKSPSAIALRQRLSLNPNLRAPFMIHPGIYTDPRTIANKFGTVVPVFRKPGHHIGPAKNPNCSCEHCQTHFQNVGRCRTRSMGDSPSNPYINWKEAFKTVGNKDATLTEQKYTDM